MKDAAFNKSTEYDTGVTPSVAINKSGRFVEVHQAQSNDDLHCYVGTNSWPGTNVTYDTGRHPSVAMNNNGLVVETHQSESLLVTTTKLWYKVGSHSGNSISWGTSIEYECGTLADVAIDDTGYCVCVFVAYSSTFSYLGLKYRVGIVDSTKKTITWGAAHRFGDGDKPKVAINNNGLVVATFSSRDDSSKLYYSVGTIDKAAKNVAWAVSSSGYITHTNFTSGSETTVAVADDSTVLVIFQSDEVLHQWNGIARNNAISWTSKFKLDNGISPSVAMSSDAAKLHQVHQSEGNFTGYFGKTLWSSSTSTLVQKWSAASGGNVPSNAALIGGREADGTRLYLARGAYLGGIQIGKVRPGLSGMSIGYGGQEIMVPSYEVLISDGQTRTPAFGDNVPAAALQIGREKDGTPLYAAIVPYLNGVHLGKVRPGFTGASIGYGGKEVMVTSYYVLVGYQ